ncbi:MAG: hypothetical protein M0Q95_01260 [Porticoccaceae bacterium]|nr:hypothetical protein [Porticoccaceae bacterium]
MTDFETMTDFERNLRAQLLAAERHVDPVIERQLRQSRKHACEQAARFRLPRFLLPLTGMTLASLFALTLILAPEKSMFFNQQDALFPDTVQSQDLDFYYWLAETQNAKGS